MQRSVPFPPDKGSALHAFVFSALSVWFSFPVQFVFLLVVWGGECVSDTC